MSHNGKSHIRIRYVLSLVLIAGLGVGFGYIFNQKNQEVEDLRLHQNRLALSHYFLSLAVDADVTELEDHEREASDKKKHAFGKQPASARSSAADGEPLALDHIVQKPTGVHHDRYHCKTR